MEFLDLVMKFVSPSDRNHGLNPLQQLLLSVRFYATGNVLTSIGDFSGTHKTTASKIIRRVTTALCLIKHRFVYLPEGEERVAIMEGFYNIAAFPRVILAIDGTHVRIQSPGGDQAEQFRNRKGYFSLNVMVACDHHLKIRNVVARWPGSSNDINVFMNSALKARFEEGMGNCVMLGDSGYPVSKYLLTPLLHPQNEAEIRYNESQITEIHIERWHRCGNA
ncbi:hypothetical protein NQ317_011571 [Molorchus minor]|uniref:DDE Tnp4 domain-containing protein n=1 Tax=Molorchus minor TaxID=1323400 RepID=A0ABQ9ITT5_9CUCU|nr:hypothetical protein NQ317_011571 [Molorchus minor]